MNILNKFCILFFPIIIGFYNQSSFGQKKFLANSLLIFLLIFFTYFFKNTSFKINFLNKKNSSFIDKIIDNIPILFTFLWAIIIAFVLFSIKIDFGICAVMLSLGYISTSFFSFYFFAKTIGKYFFFLFLEYFLLSILSFQFNNPYFRYEVFILALSISSLLISLTLFLYFVSGKISNTLKIKYKLFKKERNFELFALILILFSFYPISLSILGATILTNRNLILLPFLILIFGIIFKKIFLYKKIIHIKTIKAFVLASPLLILFITSLFF